MPAANSARVWRALVLWLTSCAFLFAMRAIPADAQAVRVAPSPMSTTGPSGSFTLSASPASVNFNLVSKGVALGSSAVAITTSWDKNECSAGCTITLYAYFMNSSAALSSAAPVVNIPSSAVLGQVPTGTPTSYTPFTQTGPFGGGSASLQLFQQSYVMHQVPTSRTDDLSLEINLSGQPQLPAGTYSGTLYIQAEEF